MRPFYGRCKFPSPPLLGYLNPSPLMYLQSGKDPEIAGGVSLSEAEGYISQAAGALLMAAGNKVCYFSRHVLVS